MRRAGFTLIEVNLAILVMGLGVLGLVALFSLGYRESRQSLEDVRSVAVAEANMNQLVAALSSTNLTWSTWKSIGMVPATGWSRYAGTDSNPNNPKPLSNPTAQARSDFSSLMGTCGFSGTFVAGGGQDNSKAPQLAIGLVVVQRGPKCSIAMRCGNRAGTLLYQPLFYTEVQFQGLRNE